MERRGRESRRVLKSLDPRIPAKEQGSCCHTGCDTHWLLGVGVAPWEGDTAVTDSGREPFATSSLLLLLLLLRMRNCSDWLRIQGSAEMPMVPGIIARGLGTRQLAHFLTQP